MKNRFKGLDRIGRASDEIWTEVHDIVQETGIKTIPMEKKCKKSKWLSQETLQIAVKRGEVKGKGEKERYTHLHYFVKKGLSSQGYVFTVVMYGCESWTIKKAECWRIDALNCGVGKDSWESLGLQGDPTSPS